MRKLVAILAVAALVVLMTAPAAPAHTGNSGHSGGDSLHQTGSTKYCWPEYVKIRVSIDPGPSSGIVGDWIEVRATYVGSFPHIYKYSYKKITTSSRNTWYINTGLNTATIVSSDANYEGGWNNWDTWLTDHDFKVYCGY